MRDWTLIDWCALVSCVAVIAISLLAPITSRIINGW